MIGLLSFVANWKSVSTNHRVRTEIYPRSRHYTLKICQTHRCDCHRDYFIDRFFLEKIYCELNSIAYTKA